MVNGLILPNILCIIFLMTIHIQEVSIMKFMPKIVSLLLVLTLLAAIAAFSGCKGGADNTDKNSESYLDAVALKDLKIGVLLPDSANAASVYRYQLEGLTSSAEKAGLDTSSQMIIKKHVTDVSFDAQKDFSVTVTTSVPATEESTTEPDEKKPAKPIAVKNETALEAASSLVSGGCNVIVAASEIYVDFTSYLAAQLPDVIFLQYGKGSSELPNLKYYSDRMYEAFYLAGVAAAELSKETKAGFVCGEKDKNVTDYVNAFAAGMSAVDGKSSVLLSSTGVKLDLVLERTLAEALAKEHKCDVISQSVVTALPQVSAEAAEKYCFGFGYDMSSDAKKYNVFSLVWKWDVFFSRVLDEITGGKFSSAPYSGGLAEGLVDITEIRKDDAALSKAVSDAKAKIISGEIKPLAGVPSDGGFSKSVKVV